MKWAGRLLNNFSVNSGRGLGYPRLTHRPHPRIPPTDAPHPYCTYMCSVRREGRRRGGSVSPGPSRVITLSWVEEEGTGGGMEGEEEGMEKEDETREDRLNERRNGKREGRGDKNGMGEGKRGRKRR